MNKQITLTLPTFNIQKLADKVKSVFNTPKPVLSYGPYLDKLTNTWYSYWAINDICYVVPTPDGVNAKEYAALNKEEIQTGDNHKEYNCHCTKCSGTGHIYGGNCYRCDAKGWLSPIDLVRFSNWEEKQAQKRADNA